MNTPFYLPDLKGQIEDIPDESIVSRTFFRDDTLRAILFGFAAGQELSEHTASMPAVLHFLEGEARLTLADQTHEIHGEAWVHMPANLSHSILARTPVKMLLLLLPPHE